MEYRLKRVDNFGAIDEVLSIDVVSDGLALAWGRMFSLGDDVQVWRGDRQLTTITATGIYRRGRRSDAASGNGGRAFNDSV